MGTVKRLGAPWAALAIGIVVTLAAGLFLDVAMPGMNGFDLCKELRALPSNQTTPVIFVTTLAGLDSRERAFASGGNDLIAKPFLPIDLAVKAFSLLRRRPM